MRVPLKLPPGLHGDDTTFSSSGRWADGSNVRYRLGRPQVIGGWEKLSTTLLNGICRTIFPWKNNSERLNIAFGTHKALQVWKDDVISDITPFGPPARLAANPLTTSSGSSTVTVSHSGHGLSTGQSVKIAGAVDTNGITAGSINGTRIITVVDANTYTIAAGANATSSGTGGGTAIVATPQIALAEGAADGTGSAGFGTGAFGVGPYGTTSATTAYYARTWSFDAWGQYLLASPRGGGIYEWQGDPSTRAVALENAPTQVTYMLVAPMNGGYQVFALGCEEEVSGVFNPMCIRHSSIRNNTEWSTGNGTTAREYVLTGGGRIVAGRMVGPYMLVWTDKDLFLGTFVGALNQPWRFDRVGRNCGLIGPNAAVVVGQTAFWASPDRQFYTYSLGGQAAPIPCPIRSEFADNLAASQGDKIVASSNAEFSEIRFDYPDSRDGYENSRFVALCLSGEDAGSWWKGQMCRTAFVDAGPTLYPLAACDDGTVYYHERGNSADGAPISWFIETADTYLDPDWRIIVSSVWPDFKDQLGGVTVTLKSRETPQGEVTETVSDPMAPGDTKADILASGRLFRVRFSGESSPAQCRIGEPVFEVARAGRY